MAVWSPTVLAAAPSMAPVRWRDFGWSGTAQRPTHYCRFHARLSGKVAGMGFAWNRGTNAALASPSAPRSRQIRVAKRFAWRRPRSTGSACRAPRGLTHRAAEVVARQPPRDSSGAAVREALGAAGPGTTVGWSHEGALDRLIRLLLGSTERQVRRRAAETVGPSRL